MHTLFFGLRSLLLAKVELIRFVIAEVWLMN